MAMEFDPYDDFRAFAGEPSAYRGCNAKERQRLETEISESFARLAERDGFASYREQALWTCRPEDWAQSAALWPLDGKVGRVFMRTALGDLFVWTGSAVWHVAVHELVATEMGDSLDWFLGTTITDPNYLESMRLFDDTALGRDQSGPLEPDQIYLWSPALALGGSPETSKLERTGAVTAYALLSQLGDLKLRPY